MLQESRTSSFPMVPSYRRRQNCHRVIPAAIERLSQLNWCCRMESRLVGTKFALDADIYKDDDPAFFLGFFLRAGQTFCFQSRMAASFPSRARPTGRWQLQPSFFCSIHHTRPE
jgi:hypothetical protein